LSLGDTSPQYDNGKPVSQLVNLIATPTVKVGGVQATVQYAGMGPNEAGVYELNITVPPNAAPGDQPVTVTISDHTTPTQAQLTPVFLNIAQSP
jgi:uncharacterized protein (TIGR03437 family)